MGSARSNMMYSIFQVDRKIDDGTFASPNVPVIGQNFNNGQRSEACARPVFIFEKRNDQRYSERAFTYKRE